LPKFLIDRVETVDTLHVRGKDGEGRARMDIDPVYLTLSMLFSGLGFVLFMYGKKVGRLPHLMAGLALMTCPYFITNAVLMVSICLVLAIVPFFMPES
jgi:hypothetical protein